MISRHLGSTAKPLIRSILANLLHQLNPFCLGHLPRTCTKAVVKELDKFADGDTLIRNLVQNFGRFDN
jgi:hypothetical protein